MQRDGEKAHKVIEAETNPFLGRARWSPDGQRIAYVRIQDTAEKEVVNIETSDLEGGNSTTVLSYPVRERRAFVVFNSASEPTNPISRTTLSNIANFSLVALSLSRHTTRRARAGGCSQEPRSAFLAGAREAGGTKTHSGALVKQKTAVPQGAACLSLAVLESEGRKGRQRRQCAELRDAECAG
jgi:hypothetical protein